MSEPLQLLAVVALLEDVPKSGLRRGQVGTVVEVLVDGVYEVEFSDERGRTYTELALKQEQLLPCIMNRSLQHNGLVRYLNQ